ncbi:MAG TPA: SIMPL domain-containing protein [Xanthomonadaceae bacterium]|nr:SIMPL domain-containing protein [Xanthomonadaceae bacterium]
MAGTEGEVCMKATILILALVLAAGVAANPLPQAPHVYVEGKAEVEVPVDWISLTVQVSGEGEDGAAARAIVDERARKLVEFARGIGVSDSDLGSRQLSVQPKHRYVQHLGEIELIGYQASQEIRISLRNLAHYSALIDTLLEIEALVGAQTRFHSTETPATMARAQLAAIEDARARAERFAEAAGSRLGPVHSLSEFSSRREEAALLRPGRVLEDGTPMMITPTSARFELGTPFVPGVTLVTAYVFAVYLLED